MKHTILLIIILNFSVSLFSQKINFSEPEKQTVRSITNTQIIGKLNEHFLIYKSFGDKHVFCIYDSLMNKIKEIKISSLPSYIHNESFIVYDNFFYLIYQHRIWNTEYMMARKFGFNGESLNKAVLLDSIEFAGKEEQIFLKLICSNDKSMLGVLKIDANNEYLYKITCSTFNEQLKLQHKSTSNIYSPGNTFYVSQFCISNNGSIAFLEASSNSINKYFNKVLLITKNAFSDTVQYKNVQLKSNIYLGNISLTEKDLNDYLITCLYRKTKVGEIDGILIANYNMETEEFTDQRYLDFNDEVRQAAAIDEHAGKESTLNDYSIKDVIFSKSGDYLVTLETDNSQFFLNNFAQSEVQKKYVSSADLFKNLNYIPVYRKNYTFFYPNGPLYHPHYGYFTDNIIVLRISASNQLISSKVYHKPFNSPISAGYLPYSNSSFYFVYNQMYGNNYYKIRYTDNGNTDSASFINFNPLYDCVLDAGIQVSANELLMPCVYNFHLCFGKIEF